MTQRKFFALEANEEFLGVIRPSLWSLVPRSFVLLVLITFPIAVWPSFLRLGFSGVVIGVAAVVVGIMGLRDLRRHYLDNGIYLTSLRAIDVHAKRRSVRVTELRWHRVHEVTSVRQGIRSLVGYGALWIHGVPEEEFSLVIRPLWRPELVTDVVRKVHSAV